MEGRMSADEKSAFEVRLLVEPELNEEFASYRKILNGLRDLGSDKVREKLRMIDKDLDAPKRKGVKPLWLWSTMSVAALLCLIFLIKHNGSEPLIPLPQEEGLPVSMGPLNDKVEFSNSMQLFKSGNFSEAFAGFNGCLVEMPENDTLQYYMAFSQMMLEEYDQSILRFQKVLEYDSSVYLKKTRYFLAYSYYQKSMFAEARKTLEPLISDKTNPFKSETESFMKILDERED